MRTSTRGSARERVRRTVIGAVAMLPLAAGAVLLAAPGAAAAGTTIAGVLGAAGPGNGVGGFAVFGLGGGSASSVVLSCGVAALNGNIGAGGPGQVDLTTPCTVNGNLYKASTVTVSGTGTMSGSTITNDALVSQAVSNAESASSTFEAMPATDTSVTSVGNGSYTFTATQSGINVLDLSSLSGTATSMSFSCGSFSGCQWVVNDAGAFQLGAGAVGVSGGMTSGDLLFNVYSHGASISFNPAVSMSGIFLAPFSSFQAQGSAWNGELIGGLDGTVTVMSGTAINAPPPVTVVPISNLEGYLIGVLVLGAGLAAAQLLNRRRRRTRIASAQHPAA